MFVESVMSMDRWEFLRFAVVQGRFCGRHEQRTRHRSLVHAQPVHGNSDDGSPDDRSDDRLFYRHVYSVTGARYNHMNKV